ncbi:hypothetical protein QUA56_07540 [Microcoleus sp. N3A4]|uniref:hypothetical protein n=1 Tax=Microcoleus sp. N3A4 TaxID=3055379 RepID=UPI002FD0CF35
MGRWLYSIARSPDRFYALPKIRRRQCRVPTNPVMVTSDRAIDHFVVGKRHCRVLHRPIGRSGNSIGRSIILWYGNGTAVSSIAGSGDGNIRSRDRAINYYPLPEIRTRQCRFPTYSAQSSQ